MRPSFLIMLAIGVLLMLLFWWKAWEVEEEKVAAEALITGCASGTPCPDALPACITAYGLASGACSTPCTADNQCPEKWCCPEKLATMPERLCVPRQQCGHLKSP